MLVLVLFLVVLLVWGEGRGWTMPSKKQLQLKLFRIPGLDTSDLMLFFDDNHVQDEVPPLGFRGMMKISKWQVVVWETPGDKNRRNPPQNQHSPWKWTIPKGIGSSNFQPSLFRCHAAMLVSGRVTWFLLNSASGICYISWSEKWFLRWGIYQMLDIDVFFSEVGEIAAVGPGKNNRSQYQVVEP